MMMRLQIIPREIFKVMNNISSSFSFPLLFMRQDASAQVHLLENMYEVHQCCIVACVIVRERVEREKERQKKRENSSRHIITFISFLLHLVLYVTKPHISKLINNCVCGDRKCINKNTKWLKYEIILLQGIIHEFIINVTYQRIIPDMYDKSTQ